MVREPFCALKVQVQAFAALNACALGCVDGAQVHVRGGQLQDEEFCPAL